MPMYRSSLEPVSKNGTERLTQLGIKDIIEDWIKQTVEEYELCESLKIKLCSEKQPNEWELRPSDNKAKMIKCYYKDTLITHKIRSICLIGELP